MYKKIFCLIILFFVSSCSIDTKTGVWKENNENNLVEKDTAKEKNISNIEFSYDLTYEKFKENVIQYGKRSKFPKLDK